jgi:hypothetical protein
VRCHEDSRSYSYFIHRLSSLISGPADFAVSFSIILSRSATLIRPRVSIDMIVKFPIGCFVASDAFPDEGVIALG